MWHCEVVGAMQEEGPEKIMNNSLTLKCSLYLCSMACDTLSVHVIRDSALVLNAKYR
jgi:hypothetical protein